MVAQKRLSCQPCVECPLESIASFHKHYKRKEDNKMYIIKDVYWCKGDVLQNTQHFLPLFSIPPWHSLLLWPVSMCLHVHNTTFSSLAFFCYTQLISRPFPLSFSSGFPFSLGSLSPFQTCSPFSQHLSYKWLNFITEKEAPAETEIESEAFNSPMFLVMLCNTMSKKQIGKFLLSMGGKAKHLTICVHIIKHRKVTSRESKVKVLLI